MTLAEVLERATVELSRQGARFALAVADDAEAESRVRGLMSSGFTVDATLEQTATNRLATVRLWPPGRAGGLVDLLFASSGIESEIVERAQVIEVLPGINAPVASTGDLIALKLLARDDVDRVQDGLDLRALSRVATATDWGVAADACRDIASRGFHRGRDLVALLERLRTS